MQEQENPEESGNHNREYAALRSLSFSIPTEHLRVIFERQLGLQEATLNIGCDSTETTSLHTCSDINVALYFFMSYNIGNWHYAHIRDIPQTHLLAARRVNQQFAKTGQAVARSR